MTQTGFAQKKSQYKDWATTYVHVDQNAKLLSWIQLNSEH